MTPLRCLNGISTARLFAQIAGRSFLSTAASASAPLEFLLPIRPCHSSSRPQVLTPRPVETATAVRSIPHGQRRPFIASTVRPATICVLHPQKDDDGSDKIVEITPRAASRLSDIMNKDGNPDLALRVRVESGGCHGFQYLMSLITIPKQDSREWSSVVKENDAIFQYTTDNADLDSRPLPNGPRIILDEPSLDLLKGSKVDYVMELIGSQFKIIDNPYASGSCGCGTSFNIKM